MDPNKYGIFVGLAVAVLAAIIMVVAYIFIPKIIVVQFIGIFLVVAGLSMSIVTVIQQKKKK